MNKFLNTEEVPTTLDNSLSELKVLFEKAVELRLTQIEARASIPGEIEKMPFALEEGIRITDLISAINEEAHKRFWALKEITRPDQLSIQVIEQLRLHCVGCDGFEKGVCPECPIELAIQDVVLDSQKRQLSVEKAVTHVDQKSSN